MAVRPVTAIEEVDLRMLENLGEQNAGLQRAFLGFKSSWRGFAVVLVDDLDGMYCSGSRLPGEIAVFPCPIW